MRFLCDQMLAELGRWLRIAGYDTLIITKSCLDREILTQAKQEKRLLITRDVHLLEMKGAADTVIYLKGNSLEECVLELTQKCSINWLLDPFSRCLMCNEQLTEAPAHALEQVPEGARREHNQFWFCPSCEKVYWRGSHTNHMLKQLTLWNQRSVKQ